MAQEGREITTSDIIKVMSEMLSAVPENKGLSEVYWVCDTSNQWIESKQHCVNKDCSNCSKYRKTLNKYGGR